MNLLKFADFALAAIHLTACSAEDQDADSAVSMPGGLALATSPIPEPEFT
jgi:hypothetical protein